VQAFVHCCIPSRVTRWGEFSLIGPNFWHLFRKVRI
jgi:hypothetical protein